MKNKKDLDNKIEILNQNFTTSKKKKNSDEDELVDSDYAYQLKQELLYDYDLLAHVKGEMDLMISTLETENNETKIEELMEEVNEERVVDKKFS